MDRADVFDALRKRFQKHTEAIMSAVDAPLKDRLKSLERTQLRSDKLAFEARLRRIPEERERKRLAIKERHTGLVDHTFPVAVILLVPESLALRIPSDRRRT